MEVKESYIVPTKSTKHTSGFLNNNSSNSSVGSSGFVNSNTSCSTDLNNACRQMNVNSGVSTNNCSIAAMPGNNNNPHHHHNISTSQTLLTQGQGHSRDTSMCTSSGTTGTITTTSIIPRENNGMPRSGLSRDLISGPMLAPPFGGSGNSGGGGLFRITGQFNNTISTIGGKQGRSNMACTAAVATTASCNTIQSNVFIPCKSSPQPVVEHGSNNPFTGSDTSSIKSNKEAMLKACTLTAAPPPGPVTSISECSRPDVINLECSETGSILDEDEVQVEAMGAEFRVDKQQQRREVDEEDEDEEDNEMDTGSNHSFRSETDKKSVDRGSSCTLNGSQRSDSLHPTTPSTTSSLRRTKNGILLRDRTNRLPVADRVRQKRSTMQAMTKPLKAWLCKHRKNPFPSKAEKQQLALESHQSLTQVANWFANARRRVKNTVSDPDLDWETRIQLYNSHVQGNAELLSVSSEESVGGDGDSDAELDSGTKQKPAQGVNSHVTNESQQPRVPPITDVTGDVRSGLTSPVQHKFKQSILHRYLNDSFEHSLQLRSPFENRSRNPSGSVGSHDFEDCSMSMSSRSSPIHEHSFDDVPEDLEQLARQWEGHPRRTEDDLYWKEISAALALTTLARSRYSKM